MSEHTGVRAGAAAEASTATSPTDRRAPEPVPDRATARQWVGLAVLALPCLVVSMDAHLLNLALPRIAADLGADGRQLLWIVDLYVFLGAGSLLTMGMVGDRVGRRRLLLVGAALFAATSVAAATASSATALIACRGLLGVAGATLMPSTLALIRTMFRDAAQRRQAIAVWTASFAIGGLIGPLAGGLVLERAGWSAVFLLAVPPMLVLLAVGRVLLPESRDTSRSRLDVVSAVTSLAAVLAVVVGVKTLAAGEGGPGSALAVAAGVGLGVVFVRRQRRRRSPVLEREVVGRASFAMPLVTNALAFFGLYGSQYLMAQYLQLVLGLSPLAAGAWGIPGTVAYIAGSAVGSRATRHLAPATVVTAGLAVCATGFAVLTSVGLGSGLAVLVVGSVLFGFGLAPVYSLTTEMVVSAGPEDRAGTVSAVQESGAELGGALGIALLGSISLAVYRTGMADVVLPASMAGATDAAGATGLGRETLSGALAAAEDLGAPAAAALVEAARDAFTRSLVLAEGVGAALVAAAAVAFWMLLGRRRE
jgi:DHA2 family multidrug resistance protein-like MFS transporter